MLVSVDSGEPLPLEQVKRLFGEWFSAAAMVTDLMELYLSSPAALSQPHQRSGKKHTHIELPGMLQPGRLHQISSPLNHELHSRDGETECSPSGQDGIG